MADTTLGGKSILVVYQDEELQTSDGSKGLLANVKEKVIRVAPLNIEQFTNNLRELCSQMGQVFDKIAPAIRKYDLESFELAVDVTAKGDIKFIGSVGTELKGGIKLTFRKNKTSQ